ncbi:MAG: DUF4340 domain-containing protein, partial [Bdellovibrionota bacterium]
MVEAKNGMKAYRGTLIAVAIVGALVAFTIFDSNRAAKEDRKKQEASALFKIKADDVVKVEIADDKPARVLEKKDGVWRITAPIDDLADLQEINALTGAIERETGLEKVSEEASELKTFGLDKPGLTATVTAADGTSQVLKFGSVSSYDGNLYVQRGGENEVWLVGSSLEGQFTKKLIEWRDKHLYRGPRDRTFTKVELRETDTKGKPKYRITLEKNEKNEWSAREFDTPVEVAAIEAFMEQVRALRAVDFPDIPNNATERKKLKLDLPVMTVTLTDREKNSFSVEVGSPLGSDEKAPRPATSSDLPTIASIYGAAFTT